MKVCILCGVEKPMGEFYAHDKKCKPCRREQVRAHRLANLDRIRAYDRSRAGRPNRAALRQSTVRRWRAAHPGRAKAHAALHYALRVGRIAKPPNCVACLRPARVEAHHHDYDKPLDVLWLCKPCHVLTDGVRRRQEAA